MKIATYSANLALLALIAAGLLAVPPEKSQAQAPPENPRENFVWVTNTNGLTWKKGIWGSTRSSFYFDPSDGFDKREIAQIVVPEHAIIAKINVEGCVNLTNIVFQPAIPKSFTRDGQVRELEILEIWANPSGLSNITCTKTMRDRLSLTTPWWPVYWTELELPKIEIWTLATDNGKEVEVIWREGTLQIADAVSGEWRDHIGASPLRFPLLSAKDMQFYRIGSGEPPTTEEPPTP